MLPDKSVQNSGRKLYCRNDSVQVTATTPDENF